MKCQDCGAPATVHSEALEDGQPSELHLCRSCAEKRQLISQKHDLQLPMVIKKVVGTVAVVGSDLSKLICPLCGTKYMDFRNQGRLGCPHDYVVFREGILPLLDRVHRSTHHVGKHPRRFAAGRGEAEQAAALRTQLRQAVEAEQYERAARLRDLIRAKEAR